MSIATSAKLGTRIGHRITAGSAGILLFLAAVAGVGITALSETEAVVRRNGVLAEQVVDLGRMQTLMLDMRLKTAAFLLNGRDEDADAVASLSAEVATLVAAVDSRLSGSGDNAPQKMAVQEMKARVAQYRDSFAAVREAHGQRSEAAGAITEIVKVIGEVNEVSGAIASAIGEQRAATSEISGSIQRAARGTQNVRDSIAGVTHAFQATSDASRQVKSAADDLSGEADDLRGCVSRFLADMRAA